MKSVLFDSDVLLDILLEREPYFGTSAVALSTVQPGSVSGFVAAHAVTNLYYVMRRNVGDARSRALLIDLLTKLTVAPVTDRSVRAALSSPFTDFEDGVTHAAALESDIEIIVTRNIADFSTATIPAMAPPTYLAAINAT